MGSIIGLSSDEPACLSEVRNRKGTENGLVVLLHLATTSSKFLKVSLNMGADKTLAGAVEDLLEALVAGHLHRQLHHLVNLLGLVSILALFVAIFLAAHLHHLGSTGPDGLLGDGLG